MKLILSALFAFTLVSCRQGDADSTWWNNQRRIIELRNQRELAAYRVEKQPGIAKIQAPGTDRKTLEKLRGEVSALLEEKRNLAREIDGLRGGWDDFREDILQARRSKVSGMSFDVLEAADGRRFTDARVTRIDDIGVSLTHSHGTTRLRFGDLDPASHAFFGLDGDLAGEAIRAETESRIEYERVMDTQLAAISRNEEKQRKEREAELARQESSRAIASARQASALRPLSTSVGALGETSSVSSGSSRRYSSFSSYYRRPVTRYNYTYSCGPTYSGIPFFGSHSPQSGHCYQPAFQFRPPAPVYNP